MDSHIERPINGVVKSIPKINFSLASVKKTHIILVVVLILTIASAGFFVYNHFSMSKLLFSISLKDGTFTNERIITVSMAATVPMQALSVKLDNREISHKLQEVDNQYVFTMEGIPPGQHILEIGNNGNHSPYTLFSSSKRIVFEIDRTPPEIIIESPESDLVHESEIRILGKTEPGIMMTFTLDDRVYKRESDREGRFNQKFIIDREVSDIEVTATDRAGNTTLLTKRVILDNTPPEIIIKSPEKGQIITTVSKIVSVEVRDTGSGIADCYFEVDNKKIQGTYDAEKSTLSTQLSSLDEGMYEVTTYAIDRAGHISHVTWNFIVDSTDEIGDWRVRPGAQGGDVKIIQQCLVRQNFLNKDQITGIFDTPTTEAVLAVQKALKLPETGIVDRETFQAMSNKIFVYLNEFSLVLVSPDDKVVKKYMIATGSPWYPTPTGSYHITEKQMHPTWYPPNSPWAKGAKVTPPGPGNPLGTRWIGLNANILGIHGTPSSWSIGTAASHGCMRMYIPDVEELYDLVEIGTPVYIYGSRPADHTRKYFAEKKKEKSSEGKVVKQTGETPGTSGE